MNIWLIVKTSRETVIIYKRKGPKDPRQLIIAENSLESLLNLCVDLGLLGKFDKICPRKNN